MKVDSSLLMQLIVIVVSLCRQTTFLGVTAMIFLFRLSNYKFVGRLKKYRHALIKALLLFINHKTRFYSIFNSQPPPYDVLGRFYKLTFSSLDVSCKKINQTNLILTNSPQKPVH